MNASVSFTLISLVFLTMLLAQTRSHVIQETTFSSKKEAFPRGLLEILLSRRKSGTAVNTYSDYVTDDDILNDEDVYRMLPEVKCGAYPRVERVYPATASTSLPRHPTFVMLHRCAGSCDQTYYDCQPVQSSSFYIPVDDVITNQVTMVSVTNHTKCACSCKIPQPLTCGTDKQWNSAHCRCECRDPKPCDRPLEVWDPKTCSCLMVRSDTGSRTLLDDKRAIGVHEIGKRLNAVDLPDMYCAPYPKVVPVPQRHFSQYVFPMNVQLHRCAGTPQCSIGGSHICALKRRETILLKVTEANTGSFNYVTMHNHTACHCACTKKPSDCNQFQRFDEIACACVCKRKWKCSAGKTWNPKLCYCECETPCLKDQSRDPVTCACIRSW
ncbi:balbiani ring protein 3 [Nematostella vectensis]|uniref:balbiani ring protein 3 n=1 Tax=Nematostella vectensis TaxID=45351 RepID=UPI0020772D2F|nr:balbiani ring protein 3 [Nematostella vectensis]